MTEHISTEDSGYFPSLRDVSSKISYGMQVNQNSSVVWSGLIGDVCPHRLFQRLLSIITNSINWHYNHTES